jgi:hypothetical protein
VSLITDVSPEEAAAELLRRRRGRERLIDFTQYTLPKYYADPFHYKVADALEHVEQGLCKRLMIFAPPRHGKSELSTRRFPAYFMARNPSKNTISASYNSDFATTFGRNVRDIIKGREFERLYRLQLRDRAAGVQVHGAEPGGDCLFPDQRDCIAGNPTHASESDRNKEILTPYSQQRVAMSRVPLPPGNPIA